MRENSCMADTLTGSALLQSEEDGQTTIYTAEAHEGHGKKAGYNEGNGHALHSLGNVNEAQLLADTGKNYECQGKTKGGREGVNDSGKKVVLLLDNEDGHTKDATVGSNQGKEYTEGLIKGG